MVTVRVPATSANIGAGFDSIGLAVELYNEISMQPADGCVIETTDNSDVPKDESNLVYRAAQYLYKKCNVSFNGLHIIQTNNIPLARGLGSSSACIIGGLLGANVLMGTPFSTKEILNIATEIEGHPDNVAPALLGGFVSSCIQDNIVYSVKKDIDKNLSFAAFIPSFELLTEKSRASLPEQIPFKDAVYNLSRTALSQSAFCEGNLELLPVVTQDKLHQTYRLPLIKNGNTIFDLAKQWGALATWISGAGPTIMSCIKTNDNAFWQVEENFSHELTKLGFTYIPLQAQNIGAQIIAQ